MPQSSAEAVVTGPGPACLGFIARQPASYSLRILRESMGAGPVLMIAVVGRAKLSVTNSREVLGDFDNDPRKETFRSCASSEGMHLTVWKGSPLTGLRVWHGYYHLDYSVEPNCTDKETVE